MKVGLGGCRLVYPAVLDCVGEGLVVWRGGFGDGVGTV